MKRVYFVTVIDGVFGVKRACDMQTRNAFQSSSLTKVSLRCKDFVDSSYANQVMANFVLDYNNWLPWQQGLLGVNLGDTVR